MSVWVLPLLNWQGDMAEGEMTDEKKAKGKKAPSPSP